MTQEAEIPRPGLAEALICGLWLAFCARWAWISEDAFISFVFARNLVEGRGLVFNPGMDAVDGYSNFLYVLCAAIVIALGLPPWVWVNVFSLAAGLATLFLVRDLALRHLGASLTVARLAMLLLAMQPGFFFWGTSGLEVLPQTFLFVAAAAWLALDDRPGAATKAGLAGLGLGLIRAEGIAWSPVFLALAWGLRRAEGRSVEPLRRYALVAFPPWLVWYVWRTWYYKSALPNTVVAKMGFFKQHLVRGLQYDLMYPLFEVTPILVLPALWFGRHRLGPARTAWFALMCLSVPAWAAAVGGDYMRFHRFLVPVMPVLVLVGAAGLMALEAARGARLTTAVALVVTLVGLVPATGGTILPAALLSRLETGSQGPEGPDAVIRAGRVASSKRSRELYWEARALEAFVKPGDVVTTGAIGHNAWFSRARILDMCGLVDREIARREVKWDPADRAGHEKCVGPKELVDRKPDVAHYISFYGHPEPKKRLKDWGDEMRQMFKPSTWYPDWSAIEADVEGGRMYLVGLRRAKTDAAAEEGWRRFKQKVMAHDELIAAGSAP